MKDKKELKKFPKLDSDIEAENFVETVDLSEYDFRAPLSTSFMVKTIFFENLFNNLLRHTSLIVSQIATAIFLPPALSGLHLIKFLLIQM